MTSGHAWGLLTSLALLAGSLCPAVDPCFLAHKSLVKGSVCWWNGGEASALTSGRVTAYLLVHQQSGPALSSRNFPINKNLCISNFCLA